MTVSWEEHIRGKSTQESLLYAIRKVRTGSLKRFVGPQVPRGQSGSANDLTIRWTPRDIYFQGSEMSPNSRLKCDFHLKKKNSYLVTKDTIKINL